MKHTDKNGVNKQNTHTHTHTHQTLREKYYWKGLVNMKIRYSQSFSKKPPKKLLSGFLYKKQIVLVA